jgi:hypothetical protein
MFRIVCIGTTFRLPQYVRTHAQLPITIRQRRTNMKYRTLGRTGVQVSTLVLGAMNFGTIGRTT